MSQDKNTQNKKTKMTSKQIFAIIGIILLVLLYVVTLFAQHSESGNQLHHEYVLSCECRFPEDFRQEA